MSEDGREVKKYKILPHRGIIKPVMEGFLDMLSPATPETFSKFNSREEEQGGRGVTPIDIVWLKMQLNKLLAMTDIESLDAKLNEIDPYLAGVQDLYGRYIVDATAKDAVVQSSVTVPLGPVTPAGRIKAAREQLPGDFSHRVSYYGKDEHYYL
jgi:hypothetical protein